MPDHDHADLDRRLSVMEGTFVAKELLAAKMDRTGDAVDLLDFKITALDRTTTNSLTALDKTTKEALGKLAEDMERVADGMRWFIRLVVGTLLTATASFVFSLLK